MIQFSYVLWGVYSTQAQKNKSNEYYYIEAEITKILS
jgi:hypothetical protein